MIFIFIFFFFAIAVMLYLWLTEMDWRKKITSINGDIINARKPPSTLKRLFSFKSEPFTLNLGDRPIADIYDVDQQIILDDGRVVQYDFELNADKESFNMVFKSENRILENELNKISVVVPNKRLFRPKSYLGTLAEDKKIAFKLRSPCSGIMAFFKQNILVGGFHIDHDDETLHGVLPPCLDKYVAIVIVAAGMYFVRRNTSGIG